MRRARRLGLLLSALLLGSCAPGAPSAVGGRQASCPTCNVLLISLDALRADHLGLYGYDRPTSPYLDRFAAESLVFERAYSQDTWTLPSMVSLATSLYRAEHGAGATSYAALDPAIPTLQQLLKAAGYRTAAFVVGPYLDPYFGLQRGFDLYDHSHRFDAAERVTAEALNWLETRPAGPWYLWLHYFDPHTPYDPPPPYDTLFQPGGEDAARLSQITGFKRENAALLSPGDLERLIALYDAEIRFLDDQLAKVLGWLAGRGLLDTTLVVITADHGESFHRGMPGHGSLEGVAGWPALFEELLRVPLVIRHPARSGRRISAPAQLIDVMPTVLSALGLDAPDSISGTDLLSLSPESPRTVFMEQGDFVIARADDFKMAQRAARAEQTVLYDLRHDPDERAPLDPALAPAAVERLGQAMQAWRLEVQRKRERLRVAPPAPTAYPWASVPVVPVQRAIGQALTADPDVLDSAHWRGQATWLSRPDDGRAGIAQVVLSGAPVTALAQQVTLPADGRHMLVAEARCVAVPSQPMLTACQCASAVMTLGVHAAGAAEPVSLYVDALTSEEGWQAVGVDLSSFAGRTVEVTLQAERGGPCPFHCKAPVLVDAFYVSAYDASDDARKLDLLNTQLRALGYIE